MVLVVSLAIAADVCDDWEPPVLVEVDDIGVAKVTESSGLVFVADEFRTMGDAGGESVLYTFGTDGSAKGEQRIDGATNTDWEDLGAGPCDAESGDTCIFIADIGDNHEERTEIVLWRVAISTEARETATACVLQYPDNKAYDAEALLMFPDGTTRIVTKDKGGNAKIFRTTAIDCGGSAVTLTEEGEISLGEPVTGGAVGSDGQLVALRSLSHIWVWRGCTLDWTTLPEPLEVTGEEQGEGVCFGADDALYAIGEGDPLELHALACNGSSALECPECGCHTSANPLGWLGVIAGLVPMVGRRRR